MRNGDISSKFKVQIPVVYIDPKICFKEDGEIDPDVMYAINDLWKNYNVNIRYLYVLHGTATEIPEEFKSKLKYICEVVKEFDLLKVLQPERVAVFFGEKERVPVNFKVHGKKELVEDYPILLSGTKESRTRGDMRRFKRRRGE
jgi:hypothetical protein